MTLYFQTKIVPASLSGIPILVSITYNQWSPGGKTVCFCLTSHPHHNRFCFLPDAQQLDQTGQPFLLSSLENACWCLWLLTSQDTHATDGQFWQGLSGLTRPLHDGKCELCPPWTKHPQLPRFLPIRHSFQIFLPLMTLFRQTPVCQCLS